MQGSERRPAAAAAADAAAGFSPEELEAARDEYLREQERDVPSPKVKLRYAVALAKSRKRDDKYRGIGLLEDLLERDYATEECLYWMALTYYALGELRASRSHCERLLRMDPAHKKALALHSCIKDASSTDGIVGVGIVGAVVVAGIALRMLLKR